MSKTIPSPCISVCALNEDDLCTGCFRSGTEISMWGTFRAEEKLRILEKTIVRRKATQNIQLK